MKTAFRPLAVAAVLLVLATIAAAAAPTAPAAVEIPFQKFTLENGLTVIVHEDHKAPIVAVNVWYHVGSKNEKLGRTGFAHLFEHLMFNGSENFDDDYFQIAERLGATDMNGTTNEDRTNYFQNVPTSALDTVLWLESDRMGHLLGAVTQAKLDEQRGVVQNEKRQWENQPYAVSEELMTKGTFPTGHPYSWTVIGSMDDLSAAKLEDVHEWFRTYYGAANAVIVLAGDIDLATAKAKVERYFGDIPSGPPVARHESWIAKRSGAQRQTVQDRVPHPRLYQVWNVPAWSTAEADHLRLVGDVLASGKNSRLYKRLVYDDQIASDVGAAMDSREIASLFVIQATAQPGIELSRLEAAVGEELARFVASGPTAEELRRVKAQYVANVTRGSERIGGFGGKSDILAQGQVYAGNPEHYKVRLSRIEAATADNLRDAARAWLSDGVYALEVKPFPEYGVATASADRTKVPEAGTPPAAAFPRIQRDKLSNGLLLVLAERHSVPVIEFNMMFDAGGAADALASPGTAQLALNMLDEGTEGRSALAISEEVAQLGAQIGSGSNLDASFVSLSALKSNLERSLDLYADVVLHPAFPPEELERQRKLQLAAIQEEKASPFAMALRVFPGLLYGKGHAYATSFTGSGTEAAVAKLTREDLVKFHSTWFKPNNATLVIVGDTTLAEIKPRLEKVFRDWKSGTVPKKNVATVEQKKRPEVYLIDKPGAIQSVIFAGHVAPPRGDAADIPMEAMNTVLGGTFISRLNMNLREDKHWSYGARTVLVDAKGQRPFLAFAPVQTDKTKESMQEVLKELSGIRGERPVTDLELNKVKDKRTLELPGSWETNDAVVGSIVEIVTFGLSDDYFNRYPDQVRKLSTTEVSAAAKTVVQPDKLVWVVVGDRAKIEAGIRELNLGEVRYMDADGNLVR